MHERGGKQVIASNGLVCAVGMRSPNMHIKYRLCEVTSVWACRFSIQVFTCSALLRKHIFVDAKNKQRTDFFIASGELSCIHVHIL